MEYVQKLLAQGLDYYDAVDSETAGKMSVNAIKYDTHIIAMWRDAEERLINQCEGPMCKAHNIQIMRLCLDDEQVTGLN